MVQRAILADQRLVLGIQGRTCYVCAARTLAYLKRLEASRLPLTKSRTTDDVSALPVL